MLFGDTKKKFLLDSRNLIVLVPVLLLNLLVDGDGDMYLFALRDIHLSYANVLIASAEPGASNADTDYVSWDAAQSSNLSPANGCIVMEPHQVQTASSGSDSQMVWVSQWTIDNEIIPLSKSALKELKETLFVWRPRNSEVDRACRNK